MAAKSIYEITHSCGHTVEKDLSAKPAGDRAGLARWWGRKVCTDCFKNQPRKISDDEQKARVKAREDAEEFATQFELPDLDGSAAQVAWALEARHNLLKATYEDLVAGGQLNEPDFDRDVLAPARLIDQARWWLDNREADTADVIELVSTASTDRAAVSTENPL